MRTHQCKEQNDDAADYETDNENPDPELQV